MPWEEFMKERMARCCCGAVAGKILIPMTGLVPLFNCTQTMSTFYRIVDGQIAEMWGDEDALGLMQQLSAVPKIG